MPCNGDCNQGRECICECKKETITKQHKWYNEIVAWADGAEIEYRDITSFDYATWKKARDPITWISSGEYRIKPQPKEPKYLYVYNDGGDAFTSFEKPPTNCANYIGKIKLEVDDV